MAVRLDEDLVTYGSWWRPEDPNELVPGVLRYDSARGVTLELLATHSVDWLHPSASSLSIILGNTDKGSVTLVHAFVNSMQGTGGQGLRWTVTANHAFFGAHLNSPEDADLMRLEFVSTATSEWLSELFPSASDIGARPPSVDLIALGECRVRAWLSRSTHSSLGSHRVTSEIRVSIESSERRPLDVILKDVYKVRRFFSFATQSKCELRYLAGCTTARATPGDPATHPREILVHLLDDPKHGKATYSPNWLFSLEDLSGVISGALGAWLTLAANHLPSVQWFCGVAFGGMQMPLQSVWDLSAALESLHRIKFKGTEFEPKAFKAMCSAFVNAAPAAQAEAARRKMQHINEPNLRARLNDLFNRYPILAAMLPDREKLVSEIVRLRNDFTHPKDSNSVDERYARAYGIANRLKWMVTAVFMIEIGFSADSASKILSTNRRCKYECSEGSNIVTRDHTKK